MGAWLARRVALVGGGQLGGFGLRSIYTRVLCLRRSECVVPDS